MRYDLSRVKPRDQSLNCEQNRRSWKTEKCMDVDVQSLHVSFFFFLLLSCGMCSICYFSLAGDVKTGTPQLLTLQLMEDLPNPETFLSVAKDGSCVVLLVLLNHLILFLLKHCGRYYKLLILAYIFMFICNFKQMLSLFAFLEM